MHESKAKIRAFLARYFRKHELKDDEDIFSLGFVNSLFVMQLVMFLEKEFGLEMGNEDFNFDNFRSIDATVGLLESKGI